MNHAKPNIFLCVCAFSSYVLTWRIDLLASPSNSFAASNNTQIQPLVEFLPALWLMVSIASYHDPLNPRLAFLQSRLHGYDVVGKLKS